jgi:ubiquinol-cytochrome c reductase iron-sulfur subunit
MTTALEAAAPAGPAAQGEPSRRDFLVVSASAFAAVGAAAGLWPLLHSMNPSEAARAESTAEVDLSRIAPGQAVTVRWQGKPVFVVHRTEEQIARAAADDRAAVLDPASDRSRVKRREWLVVVGVCTHLGCTPTARTVGSLVPRYGGWVCPCHYSQYDISGRVRRGPAPSNLAVPPYRFEGAERLIIG